MMAKKGGASAPIYNTPKNEVNSDVAKKDFLLDHTPEHLYTDGVHFTSVCCKSYQDALKEWNEKIKPIEEDGVLRISVIDHPRYGTHTIFNCPFCGAKPELRIVEKDKQASLGAVA